MTSPGITSTKVIAAVLPFGTIAAALMTLRLEGYRFWFAPGFWACFVPVLALAVVWFRHTLRTIFPGLLATFFFLALAWVVVRTDWVVGTLYDHMGNVSYQIYNPPQSPLWAPPQPDQISEGATSWRDSAFFYSGGAGGPIEEPELRVNWLFVLAKLLTFTAVPYLVVRVLLWLRKARATFRAIGAKRTIVTSDGSSS